MDNLEHSGVLRQPYFIRIRDFTKKPFEPAHRVYLSNTSA